MRGSFSNDVIGIVTDLGGITVIVVVAVVVAIVESWRTRSHWLLWFLVLAVAGQALATNLVKAGIGRQRPELGMLAGLDPSFPSGHTAGAAVTFAACALLLGRRRPRWVQAGLSGIAVGLAVAVAASRVLLGVHWFSDVLGGLALGWAWFSLVALAFGGRSMRFGAPVEAAERHVELVEHVRSADR